MLVSERTGRQREKIEIYRKEIERGGWKEKTRKKKL